MNDRRFFVSKFVMLLGSAGALTLAAFTLFLGCLTYVLGAAYNVSRTELAVLWIFCVLFAVMSLVLGSRAARLVRHKADPVISLEDGYVTYKTAGGEMICVSYADIRSVEIEQLAAKAGGGHILIRKSNDQIDKIYIFNLDASPAKVFEAFKERLPQLLQPCSPVQRLVSR